MALVSVSELEEHLDADFDGDGQARASQAIALASGVIESRCNRTFGRTVGASVKQTVLGTMLFLPSPPISVTSITVDGDAVSADDFEVYENEGYVEFDSTSYDGKRATVVYDTGYVTVPSEIKKAVLTVAARMFNNPDTYAQKSVGDVTVSYGRSQPGPDELDAAVLGRYTVPVVG